ncbi:MAG: 50S ribosomal protein L11 methyltransferase [Stellaceae bacterium]
MPGTLWRVWCAVATAGEAEAAARAFDRVMATVSAFEIERQGGWLVEGLSATEPDGAALDVLLALALGTWRPPALAVERLPPRDWLAENQQSFAPFGVGRYFIHGSHWRGVADAGRIPIAIDAATAFGTGEHGSTKGCLLALDRMARSTRRPRRILDMGCGTGILAIAAAKCWGARAVACDIDAEAVRVARHNAAVNGVGHSIAPHRVATPRARAVRRGAPYDLVLANILARPLMLMARDLARVASPGAAIVLAGILPWQEAALLSAWRRVGAILETRILVEDWSTLVLRR